MKKLLSFIIATFFGLNLYSQNFNMQTDSVGVDCTTGGTLYDSGGNGAFYNDNESFVYTICPGSPGFGVFASMELMTIDDGGDVLNIYDGDDITAPLFPDMPLNSVTFYAVGAQFQASVTNTSGCLTFEFISNGDGQTGDFEFSLTCNAKCQNFSTELINTVPDTTLTPTDIYLDICLGDSIFVNGINTYPQNNVDYAQSDATSSFEWYWEINDTVPDTGISQSHYYGTPGGYLARMISYDINGCRNLQDRVFKVRVAPEPAFIDLTDTILCLGEIDTLVGLPVGTIINGQIVQGDTVYFVPPFNSGDSTWLPDGNGAIYNSPANLNGFDNNAVIQNCGDILEICVNIEHSYLGDLHIELVCPNGQSVVLKAFPGGGGTYLGNPWDGAQQGNGAGGGLEYCFSDNSTSGLLVNGPTQAATNTAGNTVVPGTYQPVNPFSNLIGCPINGQWNLQITDNLSVDDGYIFNWSLDIAPCMHPDVDSFIMVYDYGFWDSATTIVGTVGNNNTILVEPDTAGLYQYTYHTTNQFGCEYDHSYEIYADGFEVDATPDDTSVCAFDPVQLNAEVLGTVSDCNYTFQLFDSFGDGWNNNTLTVSIDGVVAGTYTIVTGSNATFNLTVPGNSVLTVTYNAIGTFQNEVSYSIIDNSGATIFTDGPNPTAGLVFTQTCGGYYTYNWAPIIDLDDNTIQSPISTLSSVGHTYIVGVTNANNCTYYDTLNVNIDSSFAFNAMNDTTICFGDTIGLWANGGALSYAWTPNDGTISDTSIATPNVYPTTTTTYNVKADSTGCSQFADITVTVSNITAFVLPTNAACGIANGSLIILGSGGVGALSYTIDGGATWQPNGIYSNLNGGTYYFEISDGTSCNYIDTIVLGGGAPLIIDSVFLQNPSCVGGDGVIDVVLTDPSLILTYTADLMGTTVATQDSSIFNGLSAGTYIITIDDGSCPTIDTTITISGTSPLILSVDDSTDITCFNLADGTIDLSASGGQPVYMFSVDGINYVNTGNFNGLDTGVYTVYVQDNGGCLDSSTVTLSQADSLEITNIVVDSLNCNGELTNISFDGLGGFTPYEYSISTPAAFINSNNFVVPGGAYALQIRDSNNCLSAIHLDTVYEPALLVLSLDSTQEAICGSNVGAVFVSAIGGSAPYSYTLNAGISQDTSSFTGLATNIYLIEVTDNNGCTDTVYANVQNTAAIALNSVFNDSISCFGFSDASVQLSVTDGMAPFSFSVDGGTGQLDSLFTNLSGGIHIFNVVDSNGCDAATSVTIFEPSDLLENIVVDSLTCNESGDGEIHIIPFGGTTPYIFAVNNYVNTQTVGDFTNLDAGTYTAYLIDGNGCADTISPIIVHEPDTFIITNVAVQNILCNGSTDGEFTVLVSGGIPGYTYNVNGNTNQNSNIIDNLVGGIYTINTIDGNGCTVSVLDSITESSVLVLTIDSVKDVNCFNGNDGYFSGIATGGSPTYTYSLDNITFSATNTFNSQSTGTYTLYVRDDNDCIESQSVTINEPVDFNVVTQETPVSCIGLADGEISIIILSGGLAPYSISVDGNTPVSLNPWVETGLSEGNHSIYIVDSLGCDYSETVTISEPDSLILTSTLISDLSCFGNSDGMVDLSVQGGTPIYTFSIDVNGVIINSSNGNTATFNNLDGGQYTTFIEDTNGCFDTLLINITEPNELLLDSLVILNDIGCFGEDDAAIIAYPSGGTPYTLPSLPYTFSWSPSGATTDKADALSPGVHTVTVTDANGCTVSGSETIVNVNPIIANINPDSAFISMGDTLQLSVNVQNALTNNLQYSWSPTNGLSCTDCENPVVTVYNDITYNVVVTDSNGCTNYNYAEVFIGVSTSLFYFIPNGFSPDGDGVNDQFQVYGQDIKSVDMIVFNRWGEKVFEGTNQYQSWDGKFNGSDLGPGVFTYSIGIKFLNDAEVDKKGSVTLLK